MIFINRMLSGRELNYVDLEQTAIMRLRTASQLSLAYYRQPLIVTTSGGKDSSVCVALAERAGIPFEVHLITGLRPSCEQGVRKRHESNYGKE